MLSIQERNIPQELDLARTAVETVVRQLAAVTKTNQVSPSWHPVNTQEPCHRSRVPTLQCTIITTVCKIGQQCHEPLLRQATLQSCQPHGHPLAPKTILAAGQPRTQHHGLCVPMQMLQSELKACQQKQQQQQVAFESTIAVLQSDIAALRSKLCDTQDNTRAAVEQLRTGVNLQLEKQQQELEEQMQSLQRESVSAITLLRQDTAARASGAGKGRVLRSLCPPLVPDHVSMVNFAQLAELAS